MVATACLLYGKCARCEAFSGPTTHNRMVVVGQELNQTTHRVRCRCDGIGIVCIIGIHVVDVMANVYSATRCENKLL